MEQFLVHGRLNNEEKPIEYVMNVYGDDLDRTAIETEVCFFKSIFELNNVEHFNDSFKANKSMDPIKIAQKMNISIKNFFCKYNQILRFLRIGSHLLKKSLTENFIFCAVKRKLIPSIDTIIRLIA